MASAALRAAARSTDLFIPQSHHIQLRSLPRSALPTDIRRLCAKQRIENVDSVALDYDRFLPTGKAYVTLTQPDFVPSALRSLKGTIVGGAMIEAGSVREDQVHRPTRTRGARGRAQAAERGIMDGNGVGAGVTSTGRSVVLSGLPGKLTPDALKEFLKSFKLAGHDNDKREIVKLEIDGHEKFAFTSRHFVRLASVSEAHRLVRSLHMTFFHPEIHDTKYPIHARVVY
ncbi:hypothetical protein B0H21DRAFT_269749 [Amylocystis lapponica]|nr:hypothetical protein B0H21DRAFT_269749 [Amylocystis lapponica]